MKNGTKSHDDKKRKTKKRKQANDNAPTAKAHLSEAKTVSEAKPVMRVQATAPMPAPSQAEAETRDCGEAGEGRASAEARAGG